MKGRGGKNGFEPKARIRHREHQVLELWLQGQTQHQVAEALGITQAGVSKILKRADERFFREREQEIRRLKAQQTRQLLHVWSELMKAWHASQRDLPTKRQRRTDGAHGGASTMAEIVSQPRHGDPRYLVAALQALADIRKLWGLDEPQRLKVNARTVQTDLSLEELMAEYRRTAQLLPPEMKTLMNLNVMPAPPLGPEGEEDQ